MAFALPLARLIAELARLPGIGPKSAQRLAFHLLRAPEQEVQDLAAAIAEVQAKISACRLCHDFTDGELCAICEDPRRDAALLCAVAEPTDLAAIERTQEYRGRYHVLGGVISPMDGIGPEALNIRDLVARVGKGEVQEVILATNPTVEGDTTALYLARLLEPFEVKVTKIAFGLPVGGDLDYADQATLIRALDGRREI